MGFYGTEIVNHHLKPIGIIETCPMDFLESDSSSHAKWTFMEQWSEPSSKANENFYELMLARVVCETKLSSYACCQKAFALYHLDQFPDEGLNLVQ